MARIRSVKPSFCTDREPARMSRDARLFYLLLQTEADDKGRFLNSGKKLAGVLYPHDENVSAALVNRWIKENVSAGMVCLYEVDGAQLGHVVNFSEEQKPQHPTPSRIPRCPHHGDSRAGGDDDTRGSRSSHEEVGRDSGPELGVRRLEVVEGDSSSSSSCDVRPLRPLSVEDEEEDFAGIVAARWAEQRLDLSNPRRWRRTVAADLRRAYGSIASCWTGTAEQLADEVERSERGAKPTEQAGLRVVRPDCVRCGGSTWTEGADGFAVRCEHGARAATGGD